MNQPVRRRLSPENRRNQLLDCARQIILDHGLSTLTMERVAAEAKVSNPLIYKYFDTRLQMLQDLLAREYKTFRKSFVKTSHTDGDYRATLRSYVDVNFQQFAGGDILSILLSQADVREGIKDKERSRHAPFFINEVASEFRVATHLAERIVVLASGASIAAAEQYSKVGGDREAHIDQTVDFILGGIKALLSQASD